MSLTQEQKNWIEIAIRNGHELLEIKKKLLDGGYSIKKTDEMIKEYEKKKKEKLRNLLNL